MIYVVSRLDTVQPPIPLQPLPNPYVPSYQGYGWVLLVSQLVLLSLEYLEEAGLFFRRRDGRGLNSHSAAEWLGAGQAPRNDHSVPVGLLEIRLTPLNFAQPESSPPKFSPQKKFSVL